MMKEFIIGLNKVGLIFKMGLTKAQKHNRMMDRVFQQVRDIDRKAKCPRCKKPMNIMRGLGTVTKSCMYCGYHKFEGRK